MLNTEESQRASQWISTPETNRLMGSLPANPPLKLLFAFVYVLAFVAGGLQVSQAIADSDLPGSNWRQGLTVPAEIPLLSHNSILTGIEAALSDVEERTRSDLLEGLAEAVADRRGLAIRAIEVFDDRAEITYTNGSIGVILTARDKIPASWSGVQGADGDARTLRSNVYVSHAQPDTNFEDENLKLGSVPGVDLSWILIDIDVRGLAPPYAAITHAEASFWLMNGDSGEVGAWAVMDGAENSWDTSTVTWNSRPAPGQYQSHQFIDGGSAPTTVGFPVTTVVEQWLQGDYGNNGLIIAPVADQDWSPNMEFMNCCSYMVWTNPFLYVEYIPANSAVEELQDGFEDIETLSGWYSQNNSAPLGPVEWYQGVPQMFPAHAGPDDSYIATDFTAADGVGTVSNWLLTPEVYLQEGTRLSFWTRSAIMYPDRLQVRLSTSGPSVNVGVAAEDIGQFDTLLLDINPGYASHGYPTDWTQFVVEVSDLPSPTTGRFAFRHFIDDTLSHGDYIGVDTVEITQPESDQPPQFPSITVDELFRDHFELGPENLYPRIEFISDSMVLFEGAGANRTLGVRVFDENGNLVPDASVSWQSSDPAVSVDATSGLTASAVAQSTFSEPVRITVQHAGLGVSSTATAVMGVLATPGAPLDRAGRSSEVVVIESNWVSAVFGDRTETHTLRLYHTSVTELVQPGDILVSGNAAGVLVRVLQISSTSSGHFELLVEPAEITEAFESLKISVEGEPLEVTFRGNRDFSSVSIRSLRDDRVLYDRQWQDGRLMSNLECSGGLEQGEQLSFDQDLVLTRVIEPYASLDVDGFTVNHLEIGSEGTVGVSAGVSVNLSAGASLNGKCGLNWNWALPGLSLLLVDIGPSVSAGINLKLNASASANAGWVPIAGLDR